MSRKKRRSQNPQSLPRSLRTTSELEDFSIDRVPALTLIIHKEQLAFRIIIVSLPMV